MALNFETIETLDNLKTLVNQVEQYAFFNLDYSVER